MHGPTANSTNLPANPHAIQPKRNQSIKMGGQPTNAPVWSGPPVGTEYRFWRRYWFGDTPRGVSPRIAPALFYRIRLFYGSSFLRLGVGRSLLAVAAVSSILVISSALGVGSGLLARAGFVFEFCYPGGSYSAHPFKLTTFYDIS